MPVVISPLDVILGMQEYARQNTVCKISELDEFGFCSEEARNLLGFFRVRNFILNSSTILFRRIKAWHWPPRKRISRQGDYKQAVLELEEYQAGSYSDFCKK